MGFIAGRVFVRGDLFGFIKFDIDRIRVRLCFALRLFGGALRVEHLKFSELFADDGQAVLAQLRALVNDFFDLGLCLLEALRNAAGNFFARFAGIFQRFLAMLGERIDGFTGLFDHKRCGAESGKTELFEFINHVVHLHCQYSIV